MEKIAKRLEAVRNNILSQPPLVHNITNYVTVNDCANAQLAFGGSPIMADDINEVREVTGVAGALVINIGTLNERTIASMIASGEVANEKNIPVILDPVGGNFTALRRCAIKRLMNALDLGIIRGNYSEIWGLLDKNVIPKGVDVDEGAEHTLKDKIAISRQVAIGQNCVVAMTGVVDIVVSPDEAVTIYHGVPEMSQITGTGCVLSALTGVTCGANHEDLFAATVYSVAAMGLAGERAVIQSHGQGIGSIKVNIMNNLSTYHQIQDMNNLKIVDFINKKQDYFLYGVTDCGQLHDKKLFQVVEEAILGGMTMVQLREKKATTDEIVALGKEVKKITDKYEIPFIINDNLEAVRILGADGVHVGQEDISYEEARKVLGAGKIIGVSCDTLEQAKAAEAQGADYLGVGAVFPTDRKKDAVAVSLETLSEISKAVKIPVVAIGGINADNISELKTTGINGVAVISAIFYQDQVKKATQLLYKRAAEILAEEVIS
jgi:hydroxyethylthiazole kinase/thiamine-phosphate diphosphorylase